MHDHAVDGSTIPIPVARTDPIAVAGRIRALDALRGFALCGILLVNIPPIVDLVGVVEPAHVHPVRELLDLTVQQRFFPIFSFLFGLSFAIFLDGASRRSHRPRVLLVRRLVALGVLGAAHQLLQPGEALLPYAIVGLAVLLPASWLPTWLVGVGGVLATVGSVTIASGGLASLPGLFLLGLATARLGVARTVGASTRLLLVLFAVAAPAALAMTWYQYVTDPAGPYATRIAAGAGLLAALTYGLTVLLLLRTSLRPALSAGWEPLGRMALTNYVTATPLVIAAAPLLGLPGSVRWGTAMALAAVILVAQVLASRWWLVRLRYGPLEWCLRCVTPWERVPLRQRQLRKGRTR